MKIHVSAGIGRGGTPKSAFDAALMQAGVENYNLLHLSSIIPARATVEVRKPRFAHGGHGTRLYCVLSYRIGSRGETVWAGLGWAQIRDGSGIFIEHDAGSRHTLESLIRTSLAEMKKRRGWRAKDQRRIVGGKCLSGYLCALVVATYAIESW